MSWFRKKENQIPIPAPFTAADIKVESSICTGEKTIGFYDNQSHKLRFSELVRNESDVRDFYKRYGLDINDEDLARLMRE